MSALNNARRFAIVALAAAGLGGCGLAQESDSFWQNGFWNEEPAAGSPTSTDLGLAELAKGNYSLAEAHLADALRKDPNDQYANLAAGLLYQNTGRPKEASAFYQHLMRLNPAPGQMFAVPGRANLQPISDIASTNLALLSGPDLNSFGTPGAAGGAVPMERQPMANPMVQPSVNPLAGAVNEPGSAMAPGVQQALGEGGAQMSDTAFQNVVTRFEALNRLLNVGLITEDEFRERRAANIGALLPLTKQPPATGLDRPVPPPSQIAGRLQALSKSLQMRAISPQEHSSERSIILDALMPANPSVRTNAAPPPTGLLESADAVRRLGKLQAGGLITSDEYSAERAAIERELQAGGHAPGTVAEPMSAMNEPAPSSNGPRRVMAPGSQEASPAPAPSSGPRSGVHLASYRSRGAAMEGWKVLQRKYGNLLGSLDAELSQVNLGASKGTFYRLIAGPLNSAGDARRICGGLKSSRQFCEPALYPQG
jgi:tetratricopeptide (TPR) repeat protein